MVEKLKPNPQEVRNQMTAAAAEQVTQAAVQSTELSHGVGQKVTDAHSVQVIDKSNAAVGGLLNRMFGAFGGLAKGVLGSVLKIGVVGAAVSRMLGPKRPMTKER